MSTLQLVGKIALYLPLGVGMIASGLADHAANAVVLSAFFLSIVIIDATERLIATRPKVMDLHRKSMGGVR